MTRAGDHEPAGSAPDDPRPAAVDGRVAAVLGWLRGALVDNAALKFVALVLSLTVFILVHSDEDAVAGATVAVSYTLPEGKVLASEPVEQLRITVKGSRRRIRRFDPSELGRVNIDLRGRGEGELAFDRDLIDGLPDGVELVSISPASMTVHLVDRVERQVPVVVDTAGRPARGFHLAVAVAEPDMVTVVGAADAVKRITAVHTVPVVIEGRSGPLVEDVEFEAMDGVVVSGRERVRVRVGFGEEQGSRTLGPLTVEVRAGPGVDVAQARLQLVPAAVEVVLRGGVLDLDRVAPDAVSAFVRPTATELARGTRELEVHVVPALPGIGIEVRPPVVTVRPAP